MKLRNRCTGQQKKDIKETLEKHFKKHIEDKDTGGVVLDCKEYTGMEEWRTPHGTPSRRKITSSPQEIANSQMRYFKEKVNTLIRKLPVNKDDHLKILDQAMEKWGDRARQRPEFNLR